MVDYNDTAVGWIPDPDNTTTHMVTDQDLDGYNWDYIRYRISHDQIADPSPVAPVSVDGSGDVSLVPGNDPVNVAAFPLAAGQVCLTWRHNDELEPATPDGFKVYRSISGAAATLLTTVSLHGGTRNYSATDTTNHANETELEYTIKSYRTVGETTYESAGVSVEVTADAVGPPAVDDFTIYLID